MTAPNAVEILKKPKHPTLENVEALKDALKDILNLFITE